MCGSFGGHRAHNDGSIPASTPEEASRVWENRSFPCGLSGEGGWRLVV